jgi:hypothetical protein
MCFVKMLSLHILNHVEISSDQEILGCGIRVNSFECWNVCWDSICCNYWNKEEFLNCNRLKFAIIPDNKNMKLESIKILTGEIDYKLERINYFNPIQTNKFELVIVIYYMLKLKFSIICARSA